MLKRIILIGACAVAVASAEPWERHTIDASGHGADGVRMDDVNGDGYPDLVCAWEEAGEIRVYLHPGAEGVTRPWPTTTVGYVASPEDAVFVDLDADGAVDVVSSCEGDERTIYFHWAPRKAEHYLGRGTWATRRLEASHEMMQWMYVLPMDVDDDGDTDLVAGGKGKGAGVGWFECPKDPRKTQEWVWHPVVNAGWIMSIEAFDMNDDGRSDIVVSDRRGPRRGVYWLERPESPGESWREHRVGPTNQEEPMFLTVCRYRDEVSIFCAVKERTIAHYVRESASGEEWTRTEYRIPEEFGTAKGVTVASSARGYWGVVFSCEHAEGLSGVGIFSIGPGLDSTPKDLSGIPGTKFDQLLWHDMDGDGDLDLVTTEERERLGVVWYEAKPKLTLIEFCPG